MCELGIRADKVCTRVLELARSYFCVQVLYHGNLRTKRDMTDVADSSKVMVDLIEVASLVFCGLLNVYICFC
jgi:hypothetical protein